MGKMFYHNILHYRRFIFLGGVILLGGFDGKERLDTIYRLPNAKSEWVKLSQKLTVKRSGFVAILIPEEFANCTIPEY